MFFDFEEVKNSNRNKQKKVQVVRRFLCNHLYAEIKVVHPAENNRSEPGEVVQEKRDVSRTGKKG